MIRKLKRSEFESLLRSIYPYKTFYDGEVYLLKNDKKSFRVTAPFETTSPWIEDVLDTPVTVVVVHFGEYALGLVQNSKLVLHKTGKHFIRGKSKKGGQSSARYARIRTNQRKEFLETVDFDVDVILRGREELVKHIYFGGSKDAVRALMKKSSSLQNNKAKIHKKLLNARHANLDAIRDAIDEIWTFTVEEL